jgi:hypothetical protein
LQNKGVQEPFTALARMFQEKFEDRVAQLKWFVMLLNKY